MQIVYVSGADDIYWYINNISLYWGFLNTPREPIYTMHKVKGEVANAIGDSKLCITIRTQYEALQCN